MSNRINSIVTTIGINIGKNVFHVVDLLQQLGQRQSFLGDRSSRALPVEVVTNSTLADWAWWRHSTAALHWGFDPEFPPPACTLMASDGDDNVCAFRQG
jgi:hypothetical protein